MGEMRALSIMQPWAAAIAYGAKRYDGEGWRRVPLRERRALSSVSAVARSALSCWSP